MSTPEFESKMKRIIKQSQQLYIVDAAQRIENVLQALEAWKAGASETAAAVQSIHMQVHAMKGVALTIHFEPMHHICEAIISLLEQQNLQKAEPLLRQLPNRLKSCQAIMGEKVDN